MKTSVAVPYVDTALVPESKNVAGPPVIPRLIKQHLEFACGSGSATLLLFDLSFSGPPRATQRSVFHIGRLGEEVKLTCPMEGNPLPIIQWFRDDELIDYQWARFRANKKFLKVREAVLADSGRYICRGINGFGKEQIAVDLLIIDPADFPDLADGELPDLAPPSFTADTATARDQFEKRPGDTFTVACTVSGRPRPDIVWQRNGLDILENIVEETASSPTMTTSLLRMRNLRAQDAGTYTCVARNMAGQAAKEFALNVARSTLLENPMFLGSNNPNSNNNNKTVRVGETATFDCRVQSGYPPAIKWLKRLEPREVALSSGSSGTEVITVGEDNYRLIESGGSGSSSSEPLAAEGQYMSQLELAAVQPEDAGMYICFVTNIMGGFNYKPAFLTVLNTNNNSEFLFIFVVSLVDTGNFFLIVFGVNSFEWNNLKGHCHKNSGYRTCTGIAKVTRAYIRPKLRAAITFKIFLIAPLKVMTRDNIP
jgi:Immunoglobulin I-set domain/Immunoglobulin domain